MADDINRRNTNKTGKEKNTEKNLLIPHISVKKHLCLRCVQKPCITVCPAGTYQWDETFSNLEVDSGVCLDCGACRFVCPFDAITWSYRSKSNNQKTEKQGTGSYVVGKTISKPDYAARDIQESEPEPEPEPKADPDPVYDPDPEPEPETGSAPDPELEQDETIVPVSEPEPEPEVNSVPDHDYDQEPEPVPEPEPGRDHDPEPDYEFISEPGPEPEPKADPEPAYDHETESETEAEYVPDHEPVPGQVPAKKRSNTYSSAYAYAGASSSYPFNDIDMPEYPESPEQLEEERLFLLGLLPEKPKQEQDLYTGKTSEKKSDLTHLSLKYIILSVIKNIINLPRKSGKVQSTNGERDNVQVEYKKKRGPGKWLFLIVASVLLLFSFLYFYNQYTNLQDEAFKRIEQGVFYSNDANWTGWDGVDYEVSDGSVTLEQRMYHAPYYRYRLSPEDMPWDEAVVKMTSQLDNFSNSAYTLLTVYTSAGEISLITDPTGRLALVTDVDQAPAYSQSVLEDRESVIHLFLDVLNGDISVYVDGRHIFTEEKDYYMYTLQEIWLGAFWIGGNNQFGAPLGHNVSEVVLGDSSLLLTDYSFGQFISEQLGVSPWMWIPFVLAALLILVFLILVIRDRKRGKAVDAEEEIGIQA